MQTLTDSETNVIEKRRLIDQLKGNADRNVDKMSIYEKSLFKTRDQIMGCGWLIGADLVRLKELIGHGSWEEWVPANFPRLGAAPSTRLQNAKRCMRFWKDNQAPKVKRLIERCGENVEETIFSKDSKRRFMFGYVPQKERPALADPRFPRSASVLNLVNEYKRLRHRDVSGLQKVDMEEARSETGELLLWLKYVAGETVENPWQSET